MTQEATEDYREAVRERFTRVALMPREEKKFPVGPARAASLGYNPEEIEDLPASVTESFCGVGNPIGLGELQPGQAVLDLGSGAGVDSILAARQVAPSGTVIGIDMTPEMITKAQHNAAAAGLANVEFRLGTLEELPVADSSVEVAISNGVLNLCRDKPKVLSEVFRVLRPGGRLQMADILLHAEVTPTEVAKKGAWSD